MVETNQLLKAIQETKSDGLNTLMESLDDLTFSQYLNHILEIKHVTKAQVLSIIWSIVWIWIIVIIIRTRIKSWSQ